MMKGRLKRRKPGRPPTERGRGSSALYVRLSDDERARLRAYCEAHGTTPAALTRERLADVISGRR